MTATEAVAHWIVETYDVIAIGDMMVTDVLSPARVCMTCRDEYGVTGPCVLESGGLTADEIKAIKTLAELHEAARTAFGDVPEWMLYDIATGANEVPGLNNRRRAFSRARRSLAYAELHRRTLDTQ